MPVSPLPRRIAIHVLACLAFLALPYVFAPHGLTGQLKLIGTSPHEQTTLLGYVLMLAFLYLNYYVLIPRLYFSHRYGLYTGIMLLGFLAIGFVMTIRDRHDFFGDPPPFGGQPSAEPGRMFPPPDAFSNRQPPRQERQAYSLPPSGDMPKPGYGFELNQTLFLFLVGVFVTLSLRVSGRWRQTEQERVASELSFLKAQINPHFLFNTLNSIYALAIEQSPHTADAVVKLSSFMRYVTRDTGNDWVPLQRELDYIEQYIDLQRLRLADTATVSYTRNGSTAGLQIAPLLLISFVENAFKYGVNPAVDSPIRIAATLQNDQLHLHVGNRKVRQASSAGESGGIGLANTRARLALLYPDRHTLTITDQADTFIVDLTIQLA
ncbi:sensor histidine kinase [Spirosoma rhododendri]|uniref:Histidine kinase n=1 Tax=Spirosoma rhododendri TaxID=2728024 RepID=A0A7L5DH43_9BACT|nr:sensor histidine kinase [Spirosoma rhododendri]QJD77325.1 histidine kinase [Spirosoma rhododendri]